MCTLSQLYYRLPQMYQVLTAQLLYKYTGRKYKYSDLRAGKTYVFRKSFFRFLVFFSFLKILRHSASCHIIYNHLQTIA